MVLNAFHDIMIHLQWYVVIYQQMSSFIPTITSCYSPMVNYGGYPNTLFSFHLHLKTNEYSIYVVLENYSMNSLLMLGCSNGTSLITSNGKESRNIEN